MSVERCPKCGYDFIEIFRKVLEENKANFGKLEIIHLSNRIGYLFNRRNWLVGEIRKNETELDMLFKKIQSVKLGKGKVRKI